MEEGELIGWRAERALKLLGVGLVVAAIYFGYVNFLRSVWMSLDRGELAGVQKALIAAWALSSFLLLAAGIAALLCTTRRTLWVVGALGAATAAGYGASLILYPQAVRASCEQRLAGEHSALRAVDPTCRAGS